MRNKGFYHSFIGNLIYLLTSFFINYFCCTAISIFKGIAICIISGIFSIGFVDS
nr:MAG TPA: hypothetical protein [Caudoviricetes sp.]